MSQFKTIDLFAGCGGLTLGLHNAGFSLLFAIEKDPMAFETLAYNLLRKGGSFPTINSWPSWVTKTPHDIVKFVDEQEANLKTLRGAVDLGCGGPPCQGCSGGGLRDGADTRNALSEHYLKLVALVRPRFVLLENVEGMTRAFVSKPGSNSKNYVDFLKSELLSAGYVSEHRILDASKYGVPQKRKRMFLFAVNIEDPDNDGLSPSMLFTALEKWRSDFLKSKKLPLREITAGEALSDLISPERTVCPDAPKFMCCKYGKAVSRFAVLMRKSIRNGQIPDSHRFSNHTKPVLAFYKLVHASMPYGRLPRAFLREQGTKKDKKVFLDPTKPCSTITTHPDEFIHFAEPRIISVREMARLQSFPDTFHFKGRYTINGDRRRFDVARCSQVGNAVPPILAEALGYSLKRLVKLHKSSKTPLSQLDEWKSNDVDQLNLALNK